MADPEPPTDETAAEDIDRLLAEAFGRVEAEGVDEALRAHAERLSDPDTTGAD